MIKKYMAIALAAGMVSMPALAAPFVPFTINLSATDASAATATYNFDPGTYTFTLVKDVYTAFAPATPSANNWTDYYQYSINGGASTFYNPTGSNARFATADAAFNAFSALSPLTLTFGSTTSVKFQIGDSLDSLGDNSGGTSLRVAAVPEPASWALMLVGFGGVGYALRRRRPSTAAVLS